MKECIKCGKPLLVNEIGLHKRLINRSAEEYMCKACLAKHFNVSAELLDEKIEVLTALKDGKPPDQIPNYYSVLENFSPDQHWD